MRTHHFAVIGCEYNNRIILQPMFLQSSQNPAELLIHAGNHSEVVAYIPAIMLAHLGIRGRDIRAYAEVLRFHMFIMFEMLTF